MFLVCLMFSLQSLFYHNFWNSDLCRCYFVGMCMFQNTHTINSCVYDNVNRYLSTCSAHTGIDCSAVTLIVKLKVAQSCPTLCDPMDYTVHRTLPARILEWIAFPPPGDLPNPGIEPRSPALHADSLPAEPQRKPRNTGVGGLSLLQGISLTQESNRGLLHCRQILHQLSYQGS